MNTLKANDFINMLNKGLEYLSNNKDTIDKSNYFPMPNFNTASNLIDTLKNSLTNISNSDDISLIVNDLYKNLIKNAKGSSGLIFLKIIEGINISIKDKKELELNDIVDAFILGAKTAYQASLKPIEGTMLSVIKNATIALKKEFKEGYITDINDYFNKLYLYGLDTLNKSQAYLPKLKVLGVNDAGAMALVEIFKGFNDYLN